jgi:hypothetical protein
MNKSNAQDASKRIALAHAIKVGDPDLSREIEHRVHRAVHDHLRQMIPGNAITATLDEAEIPKVVAISRDHLYELTVGEITEDRGPVPTRIRMRTIDPTACSVDCEVKFSGQREDDCQIIRETAWRFLIGDIDLEFETFVNRQNTAEVEAERFALALAKAIGWEAPGDSVPLVAVA